MKLISRNIIRRLTSESSHTCVSLYMPIYNTSTDDQWQNPIRYKNLIKAAEQELARKGRSMDDVNELLDPIREIDWGNAIAQQRRGLAVFLSKGSARTFALPYEIPEFVFVHQRYYVRPLLPYLGNNGSFYIATVNRYQLRLYEASQYSINRLRLDGIPDDLSEERYHDGRAGDTAYNAVSHQGKDTLTHPKGAVLEDTRVDFDTHLRHFNDAIMRHLQDEHEPLVLLGEEHLLAEFEKICRYGKVVEKKVHLNPQGLELKDIHQHGLHAATLHLRAAMDHEFRKYNDLKGTGKISSDLVEVVQAAHDRRIEALFLNLQEQYWGNYDQASRAIALQSPDSPNADDLIDLAAYRTLENNGEVYAALDEQTPDGAAVAAIFRF